MFTSQVTPNAGNGGGKPPSGGNPPPPGGGGGERTRCCFWKRRLAFFVGANEDMRRIFNDVTVAVGTLIVFSCIIYCSLIYTLGRRVKNLGTSAYVLQ